MPLGKKMHSSMHIQDSPTEVRSNRATITSIETLHQVYHCAV